MKKDKIFKKVIKDNKLLFSFWIVCSFCTLIFLALTIWNGVVNYVHIAAFLVPLIVSLFGCISMASLFGMLYMSASAFRQEN